MKETELPIHALYPEMHPDYQQDYEAIRLLLASPSAVILQLEKIETALALVSNDDSRFTQTCLNERCEPVAFDRLEITLLETEHRFAFGDVVHIPPGGNDFDDPNYGSNKVTAKAWRDMIEGAHPFRDYGASRPHGENTHRIQWFFICAAFESGYLKLSANKPDRICDLYRATTHKPHKRVYFRPSDGVRYVKSVWTDLFDFGLTKVIDARCTIWIQREILFGDWKNYFPFLFKDLAARFVARGGVMDRSHAENEQFFNGTVVDQVGRRTLKKDVSM